MQREERIRRGGIAYTMKCRERKKERDGGVANKVVVVVVVGIR